MEARTLGSLDKVQERWRAEYLHDDELLYGPARLADRCMQDVGAAMAIADRLLADGAAKLHHEFAARNGLEPGQSELGQLPDLPVAAIASGSWEHILSAARTPAGRAAAGAGAGGVGALLGVAVGSVAGQGAWRPAWHHGMACP